jgi:predicted methyltransferase
MTDILMALTFGFAIYGVYRVQSHVIEATRRLRGIVQEKYKITIKKRVSCPECNGTNLDTTNTKCWDCLAADQLGG